MSNKGYYFPPTVIECENHNLPTAENELFGPVLSVMKFDNEEEVIKKMTPEEIEKAHILIDDYKSWIYPFQ